MSGSPIEQAYKDKYNFYRHCYHQDTAWRDRMGYPHVEDNHVDYNVYKNYFHMPYPTSFNYQMMGMYNPHNTRRQYRNVQPFNITDLKK